MSDASPAADDAPKRKGKGKLLIVALALALLTGGGGFYAVYSGMLDVPFLGKLLGKKKAAHGGDHAGGEGDGHGDSHGGGKNYAADDPPEFIALDPLVISLGPESKSPHLKVTLTIEAAAGRAAELDAVKPRLVDVLNGFLRAVDEREFEVPRSMERLRAQMLRRVQLVSPPGAVQDLLIQEFVLN